MRKKSKPKMTHSKIIRSSSRYSSRSLLQDKLKKYRKYTSAKHLVVVAVSFAFLAIGIFAFTNNYLPTFLGTASVNMNLGAPSNGDYANQDGTNVSLLPSNAWLGSGTSKDSSYLGLRFSGAGVPTGANITSAKLVFTTPSDQTMPMSFSVYAEKEASPAIYTATNPPSARQRTIAMKTFNDNVKWTKNTEVFYDITSVAKEAASCGGNGKIINIIIRGKGNAFSRKFINVNTAYPKLILTYDNGSGSTTNPTPSVTPTPISTPLPTAIPTVGSTQPNSTPTPTPIVTTIPGGTTVPPVTTGANSYAMGLWTPSKWDTCSQADHDSFFVIGPDGKKYPTWHPPVMTKSNGSTCTFGHEHGRNPSGYQYWSEIKTHFAFDANKDGTISSTELATAGIPFNYTNEQLDSSNLYNFVRHEDHVGNKIEFINGEGDGVGTDAFDNNKTGGVVVPIKTASGSPKWTQSGIRCHYFHKLHQGVSTPDALTMNLHEFVMHTKCESTRAGYPSNTTLLTGFIAFQKPGEFTKFCFEDRSTIIRLGTTSANASFPSGPGFRNIVTRDCVESKFLVPQGQFSANPYEDWDGELNIVASGGRTIVNQHGAWEVLDAIRYYNPSSSNKISYLMDLCYEVESNGDRARGGSCDSLTNYGSIKGITYDDPRGITGTHRGQYINPPISISNAGGAKYWYTDPFGKNASTTPFVGSIKQWIDPVNASTSNMNTDPRIIQRFHDTGGRTVHAPN